MMNANQDYSANDFGRCLTCGAVHPQCRTIGCSNLTHCPPDEPGEPFTRCDACDGQMSQPDESEASR